MKRNRPAGNTQTDALSFPDIRRVFGEKKPHQRNR